MQQGKYSPSKISSTSKFEILTFRIILILKFILIPLRSGKCQAIDKFYKKISPYCPSDHMVIVMQVLPLQA